MSVLGATALSWEASWVYVCWWGGGEWGIKCLLCKCEALSLNSRTYVKLGGAAPTCAPITRETGEFLGAPGPSSLLHTALINKEGLSQRG